MTPEDIIKMREELGITQEKFANLLGTSFSTVNRWENGKSKPSRLSIRQLKEIKDNYGSYLCRRKKLKDA